MTENITSNVEHNPIINELESSDVEPIQEAKSLFSSPDEDLEKIQESLKEAPKWWLDKNTPGVGEKPEYLPEKFNSVEDLGESYKNLVKKLGERKAPEEYDTKFLEGLPFEKENERFQKFVQSAKDQDVSQDFFEQAMNLYIDEQKANQVTAEGEVAKLGEGGPELVQEVTDWIENNFAQDKHAEAADLMLLANNIKFAKLVKESLMPSTLPTGSSVSEPTESKDQLQDELGKNWDRFNSDPLYANEWQRRFRHSLTRAATSKKS